MPIIISINSLTKLLLIMLYAGNNVNIEQWQIQDIHILRLLFTHHLKKR